MLVDVGSPSRNLEIGTTHWLNLTSYAVIQVSSLFSETMDQNSATLVPKIKQLAVLEIHHLIHSDKHRHWLTILRILGLVLSKCTSSFARNVSAHALAACHAIASAFSSPAAICRARAGKKTTGQVGLLHQIDCLMTCTEVLYLAFSWQQRHGQTLPRRKRGLRELACSLTQSIPIPKGYTGVMKNLRHGAPNPAWSLWYEETSIHTPNSCGVYIAYIYIYSDFNRYVYIYSVYIYVYSIIYIYIHNIPTITLFFSYPQTPKKMADPRVRYGPGWSAPRGTPFASPPLWGPAAALRAPVGAPVAASERWHCPAWPRIALF